MKERPIIFSAPMVRAILDGRKTQTRRVVKGIINADLFEPLGDDGGFLHSSKCTNFCDFACGGHEIACPYGVPGDRLWVRETWCCPDSTKKGGLVGFAADGWCGYRDAAGLLVPHGRILEAPGYKECFPPTGARTFGLKGYGGRWRPSIHMPRWASRLTLYITSVRVERLQAISEADAIAEGCEMDGAFPKEQPHVSGGMVGWDDAREWYADLWDSINGKGSWAANPWVWVVEFRRIQP